MAWHHSGGGAPQGSHLNPVGYGSAFNTGIAPSADVPWANGLASFGNQLAQNMQQKRLFDQQQKLAGSKADTTAKALPIKNQNAIDLENVKEQNRERLAKINSANKEQQQGRMNPGKIFQDISLKYGLSGNAAADSARFGANYPYIKQQVLAEHSKALGFGTPTDPNYQKILQSDTFKQSIVAGGGKPPQGADVINPVNPVFPAVPPVQGGSNSAANPDLSQMPQAPNTP